MAQARGTQTTFTLVEETAYGTTPGTPAGQQLYLTANNIQANQTLIDSNTLQANRERDQPVEGNISVTGTLDFELGAEWSGTLFKHIMGNNVDSGSDPYTHTMDLQDDLPAGFMVETDYGSNISGDRYRYFNGLRVASASLTFPAEGFCTASVNVIGSNESADSSPLDASIDDNGNTPFSAFLATIEEGGGSIATVLSATINLDNGLDESSYVIGNSGVRTALPEGFATVTGTLTAQFDSVTLLDKAIAGTESSLKIMLTRGDGLGSAGNEYMEFFVQQLLYERTTPPITGPAGVIVTLPFKSYLSGSTSALQVIIKNAVATV